MTSYLNVLSGYADFKISGADSRKIEVDWPLAPDPSGRLQAGEPGTFTARLTVRHNPDRKRYEASLRQIIAYPHGGFRASYDLRARVMPWEVARRTTRFSRTGLRDFADEAVSQVLADASTTPPHPAVAAVFTVADPS